MICVGTRRAKSLLRLGTVVFLGGASACQPAQEAKNASPSEHSLSAQNGSSEGTEPVSQGTSPSGASVEEVPSSDAVSQPIQLEDGRESDPSKGLPELSFSHLGMHIGGESNSPESKLPWFKGIEAGEVEILRCYRFVDEPRSGGSYGVDLYVSRNGGAPEVRGSRQKLGGQEFDDCMKQAFGSLDFQKPERPTVFSYSLLFALKDK